MVNAFFRILNMSLTASVLILIVMVLRFFLRKAPKWISCLMWAVVAVRLLCPVSIESALSLIPSAEPVPSDIVEEAHPQINSGIPALNQAVNPALSEAFSPAPGDSANPLQVYSFAAAIIWVCGIAILLFYAGMSYLLLCRKVRASLPWITTEMAAGGSEQTAHGGQQAATDLACDIKICDDICTPFILGVLRPRIYIPSGLDAVQTGHVIAHENAHLRRKDHLWKPLGYLTLVIHWFNPLVWIAYVLLCRDIELACDENVIQKLEKEESRSYSASLLACSVSRRSILICPLAFGEVGVKERISHVLHYKKPAVWIAAAAVLVCAVVALCFLTNPKQPGADKAAASEELFGEDEIFLNESGDALFPASHPEKAEDGDAAATDLGNVDTIATQEKQAEQETADPDKKAETLDEAVISAILTDGAVRAPSLEYTPHRAASFIRLGEETSKKDGVEQTTVYGMAMYMEAEWNRMDSRSGICETSSYHMPVVITIAFEDEGYQWLDYWTPGEGSYYIDSIKEKFPDDIAGAAMDTQRFVYANTMCCFAQFLQEDVGDVFGVIGRNLDLVCMADTSSNPQDYIDHAVVNYRELIYYGEKTLAYRDKFRDTFDGLRAVILDRACADIEEIIAAGYYKKTENPTGDLLYRKTEAGVINGESPKLQAQSSMTPDYSEYENLDVDYVEKNGQYIVEGDMVLQYKKVLKGRDPNAVKSLVFVVLTNDQNVTWEQVFQSTISSNSADFLPGTIIIGMKAVDD